MTEERKQELKRLLNEAIDCLEIRPKSVSTRKSRLIDKDEYRAHLHRHWEFYSEESSWFLMSFEPYISSDDTKSRLLDYIREELVPFIYNDRILTASKFIIGGYCAGFPIENLLEQLLKIAIVRGIDGAISELDGCLRINHGSFKQLALVEGITIEKEIEVFDGVRFVPLSNVGLKLTRYLQAVTRHSPGDFLSGKTLLVIDCCISPIFHKPFEATTIQEYEDLENSVFRIEVFGKDSAHFNMNDFSVYFLCHALSFICNHRVEISFFTRFLEESQLFNLSSWMIGGASWREGSVGDPIRVGEAQIDEAKRLYQELVGLDSSVWEKLKIPFERWIKSIAGTDPVDKMIDLGIALEALYVQDGGGDTTYKLAIRAARHLGKDEENRTKLLKMFKQIYRCRSDAVHRGRLERKIKFGDEKIPTVEFIERAQFLCRQSITQILKDVKGDVKYPDWDNLMLGGDS